MKKYQRRSIRVLLIFVLVLPLSGCDISFYGISTKLFAAMSWLTGHGPDEAGLSPAKRRPHALPLNNPSFVPAAGAVHMRPDDLVIGVVVKGQARAYPWWLVVNHHVINDTVVVQKTDSSGNADLQFWEPFERDPHHVSGFDRYIPVLLTLCEACSGAAAFVPVMGDSVDRPLVFSQCRSKGSWTGDYNAIGVYTMCDLRTQSRWHPFTGEAKSGSMSGERLTRIPVSVERWDKWAELHPQTRVVIAGEEARDRTHSRLTRLEMGGGGMHPTFRRWAEANPEKEDTRLGRTELVLGVGHGGGETSQVIPYARIVKTGGVVETELDGEPYLYLLVGSYRAAVFSRRLDSSVLSFEVVSQHPMVLRDGNGTLWNELGTAIEGEHIGRHLQIAEDSYMAEWADWSMEHPGSEIIDIP